MSNKKGMRKDKAKVLTTFLALFLFLGVFTLEADSAGTDDQYQAIFDAAYYAAQYPDVTATYGTDARALYRHFVYQGIKEGRSPSAEFVLDYYKANYPDLSELGHVNIYYYRHYVRQGREEGREASKLLSDVAGSTAQTLEPDPSGNIVQVVNALYSYEEMMDDIDLLVATYPDRLSSRILGNSYEGRPIPLLTLGNSNAPYKVLVQSSIHAREYMATQLTMKMIENICQTYDTADYRGIPYNRLFDQVCFTILPMMNPDGVSISQEGLDGAIFDETRTFMLTLSGGKRTKLTQIKANARGIDLNRNFPIGFKTKEEVTSPALAFYAGDRALSEPESMALANLAANGSYSCFLSFHTMGNIIYYGSSAATAASNEKSRTLAALLNGLTGFKYYGPTTGYPNGSFADFATWQTGKASVTIELGNVNPVPIWQFPELFEKNKKDFPAVAFAVLVGTIN